MSLRTPLRGVLFFRDQEGQKARLISISPGDFLTDYTAGCLGSNDR